MSSFYKVSIILILKYNEDITGKEKHRQIFFMNIDSKNPNTHNKIEYDDILKR